MVSNITPRSKLILLYKSAHASTFRVQSVKCPANCKSCSSGDHPFQTEARLRIGSQSSSLTAGFSPVKGSTGGDFPLLTSFGAGPFLGSEGKDSSDSDELSSEELDGLSRPPRLLYSHLSKPIALLAPYFG